MLERQQRDSLEDEPAPVRIDCRTVQEILADVDS